MNNKSTGVSVAVWEVEAHSQLPCKHFPWPQLMPQLPQWAESTSVLISQPSAISMLQLANPRVQVSSQVPSLHCAFPFDPPGHTVPQVPQWLTSSATCVSQILELPLQIIQPGSHTGMHAPPLQVGVPLVTFPQVT